MRIRLAGRPTLTGRQGRAAAVVAVVAGFCCCPPKLLQRSRLNDYMEHENLATDIIVCGSVFNWTKDARDFSPLLLVKTFKNQTWTPSLIGKLGLLKHESTMARNTCAPTAKLLLLLLHRPPANLRERCPPDGCETINSLFTRRSLGCCYSEPTTTPPPDRPLEIVLPVPLSVPPISFQALPLSPCWAQLLNINIKYTRTFKPARALEFLLHINCHCLETTTSGLGFHSVLDHFLQKLVLLLIGSSITLISLPFGV